MKAPMKGDTEKATSMSSEMVFVAHISITYRLWIEPPRFALRTLAQSAPARLHHQFRPGEDIEHRAILLPDDEKGLALGPGVTGSGTDRFQSEVERQVAGRSCSTDLKVHHRRQ
jgi:hypothetical protein